ncbi:MAG: ATP-binding cassette domain-containing protein [Desulfocapsaceae bacterium]|jgi:molybdate transport system ATP-binding protein
MTIHRKTAQPVSHSSAWLEISGLRSPEISIRQFLAAADQSWCVLGDNRSGIEHLVDLLSGAVEPDSAEVFRRPPRFGLVSFKGQQEIFEQEVRKDETDFIDRLDPGTPARAFLNFSDETLLLVQQFRLEHVLDSGYRQLSSGESRKLLILKALSEGAEHLLIENPYDGLDRASCREFDRVMEMLLERDIKILLVLSSRFDIPGWCTHLAWVERGALVDYGLKASVLEKIKANDQGEDWQTILAESPLSTAAETDKALLLLVNGHAGYSGRTIFSNLDLEVRPGQHTLVTGPNGAGKSTLLGLVTGDHQDCYRNELYLFSIRRGSGESIWELKHQMGIVSPALHREHYVPGSSLQIVVSGFFDSIGLYRKPSRQQQLLARSWLRLIGLSDKETTPFRRLSFAEQRLVLIARALIKLPKLLVLDEPTHGLDDANRTRLLDFLELVAEKQISTIIYVSHREDEFRSFFRQHIRFDAPAA